MRNQTIFGLTAALALLLPGAQAADTYKIDPAHTSLTFSVRHMGLSNVKGHFDEFTGSLVLDNGAIQEATATIQVQSINTGIAQRDKHLRTGEFFDVAKCPQIAFKTTKVVQDGEQTVLVGNFTMRGVTKEIRLPVKLSGPVKDPMGNTRIGLEAKTTLNRKDYGIQFNALVESGSLMVGEEVAIEIAAEATKTTGEAGSK